MLDSFLQSPVPQVRQVNLGLRFHLPRAVEFHRERHATEDQARIQTRSATSNFAVLSENFFHFSPLYS
jgi:hypothetical protein